MDVKNIDYNRAMKQAIHLDSISTELKSIAEKQLSTIILEIRNSWQGPGSQEFIEHCEETQSEMLNAVSMTKNVADDIRKAIANVKEKQSKK